MDLEDEGKTKKLGERLSAPNSTRKLPANHYRRRHLKLQPGQESPWAAPKKRGAAEKLSMDDQTRLIVYWRKNPGATYEKAAELMKVSERTILRYLRKYGQNMKTKGLDFLKR